MQIAAPASHSLERMRRASWSLWGVTLVLVGLTGAVLRLWVYQSPLGIPDSDEAVVGLMARYILHGSFTTFFWGQPYGGSQEALLTAPAFLLFGSSWLVLRLIPIGLYALATLVVWRVGRRTIGEPGAKAAAALLWLWPPFAILHTTHQYGFYASDIFYCAVLLLLSLRIVERPDRIRVGVFGLVLGLAFWQTSQIVPIAAGVIPWTIWRQRRCLRHLWVALPLAALGALPWILYNLRHDWASLDLVGGQGATYARRLRLFVSPIMPELLGLRGTSLNHQALLLPALLTYGVFVISAALFVYGAYKTRKTDASLLYVVTLIYPFVYAISARTFHVEEPRYAVALSPLLVLLVGQILWKWRWAAVAFGAATFISVVYLHRIEVVVARNPSPPRDLTPLISTLDRLGLDRVYAEYYVAYRLDFETRERIIAVENRFDHVTFRDGKPVLADDPVVHWEPYEADVGNASRIGFVFFRSTAASRPIVLQLKRHGFRRYLTGPLVIYAPPGPSPAGS